MLAARRAARDALSEMSAQNARLVAAYVERKAEAGALREALRRQEQDAQVGRGAVAFFDAASLLLAHFLLTPSQGKWQGERIRKSCFWCPCSLCRLIIHHITWEW